MRELTAAPRSLNPTWPVFSIWRDPEATIRHIIHENPGYRLYAWPLLASLAGPPLLIRIGMEAGYDGLFIGLLWGSLLSHGPVLELAQLFIGAWVLRALGARYGGVSNTRSLQVVVAWANVPIVALLVVELFVWFPAMVVTDAFSPSATDGAATAFVVGLGVVTCVELAAIAASMMFLVRGVAAVHEIHWKVALRIVLLGWAGAMLTLVALIVALGGARAVPFLLLGPLAAVFE